MTSTVEYEAGDRIAHIRFNRPEVLNAINPTLMSDFSDALAAADGDDDVSVIIVSGNGRSFGVGYDLKHDWSKEAGGPGPLDYRAMLGRLIEFELTPWECTKPVIAMVRGHCLAGSCEVAMMCCVTFASENATFGEPEIRFSTSPPALIMPWLVGLKKARELLYTGDTIDARAALEIGMINRVVPDDELEAETLRYARRVAAIAPEALKATKATINKSAEIMGFRQALDYANEINAQLSATKTEVYRKFAEIRDKEGLGAALKWRESQFE